VYVISIATITSIIMVFGVSTLLREGSGNRMPAMLSDTIAGYRMFSNNTTARMVSWFLSFKALTSSVDCLLIGCRLLVACCLRLLLRVFGVVDSTLVVCWLC